MAVATLGAASDAGASSAVTEESWSLHVQSTTVVQGHPNFSAQYSGPHSLDAQSETKETASFDVFAGVRGWEGAEIFIDGLVWQGFGLSDASGVEGFPNGEAFRLGTHRPNAKLVRFFLRQTLGLGGGRKNVENDALALGGTRDASRLTFTFGKLSVKDIFDNNAYANDPRTQFLSWALMANEAWDYPADSLGYTNGFAAELTKPLWALRVDLFQMPRESNGLPLDSHLRKAGGAVVEWERNFKLGERLGGVRGERWGRANDVCGMALVCNGLSGVHQRFLAAGGTGILAGDGALRYAWERSDEIYYNWKPTKWIAITLDGQFVQNPAFNRDRGPLPIFAARAHIEY